MGRCWFVLSAINVCSVWILKQKTVIYWNHFVKNDRSDESDDEINDSDIDKILIVTQTPPYMRKHPGGDRTGDHQPRSKMSAELSKIINDGLFYYEQDLWKDDILVKTCRFLLQHLWVVASAAYNFSLWFLYIRVPRSVLSDCSVLSNAALW